MRDKDGLVDFNNLWLRMPDNSGLSPDYQSLAGLPPYDFHESFLKNTMSVEAQRGVVELTEMTFKTTWQEYFQKLNEILERLEAEKKINLAKIKNHVQGILDSQQGREIPPKTAEEYEQDRKAFNKMLEEIYIELRMLGFSHYEVIR